MILPGFRLLRVFALPALLAGGLGGCGVFGAVAKLGDAIESEKMIEVLPQYRGLENKTVAVVVSADRGILYEYPTVVPQVLNNVAIGIQQHVSGAQVLSPATSMGWCFRTPNWHTMPLGEMAEELGVDRVVVVNIIEFRLTPPGNHWIWEGVAAADVGIIERDSYDPDAYAEQFGVTVQFPETRDLARESEPEAKIQLGLTAKFTQTVTRLFYAHSRPKYPNRKL